MDTKEFDLLTQRSILDILDGDTILFEESGRQFKMPYLSGPKLVDLSNWLGLPVAYQKSGPSRWMYLRDLIRHCIKRGSVQNLLGALFGKEGFANELNGLSAGEADRLYKQIASEALQAINGQLYFSGNELAIVGARFVIRDVGSGAVIEAPTIESVDKAYVHDIAKRAAQDAVDGNYDSAITKARTLLEEVFCYAIEARGQIPSDKGKINVLYKQVKDLYNMHADAKMDLRVKTLLSGLEKIVSSIGEMRNAPPALRLTLPQGIAELASCDVSDGLVRMLGTGRRCAAGPRAATPWLINHLQERIWRGCGQGAAYAVRAACLFW